MSLINEYQKSLKHSQDSVDSSVPPLLLQKERKRRIPTNAYVVVALAMLLLVVVVFVQRKGSQEESQVPSRLKVAVFSNPKKQLEIVRKNPETLAKVPVVLSSIVTPVSDNNSSKTVITEPENITQISQADDLVPTAVVNSENTSKKEQVSTKLLSAILTELKTINKEVVPLPKKEVEHLPKSKGNSKGVGQLIDEPEKPSLIIGKSPPLSIKFEVSVKKLGVKEKNLVPTATAAQKNKKSLNRIYQAAIISYREKRFQEAEAYYLQILDSQPGYKNTLLNLSALYIDMGQEGKALALVDRMLADDPNNSKALVNRGNIALKKGKIELAKSSLKKALEINQNEVSALTNLTYIAGEEGDVKSQEGYLIRLLEIAPESSELRLNYASIFEKTARIPEAIAQYKMCLEYNNIKEDQKMAKQIRKRIKLLEHFQ